MEKLKLIYLIGLMGAGKTYWGQLISKTLHIHYADLDDLIENKLGYTIVDIFNKKGEEYFRKKEAEVLREQKKMGKLIISTGGGTPCFYNNMQWMNNTGKTIWLNNSIPNIFNNLISEKSKRPLISNLSNQELQLYIENLYKERLPYYKLAKYHVNIDEINLENLLKILKQ